jgi:GT2 family glycosyltransferase/ubiquinone/menaquinone biosynthesis C-methylase UbiE
MSQATIPVIIPAYRKPHQLQRCLAALERQSQPVEVFVRDNNVDNVLFTAAINEGIRRFLATDCPAMLLLNQDMYLADDAVEQLWRFMQAHPKCGIATPIEVIKDNPQGLAIGGGLEAFPLGRHAVAPLDALRHDEKLYWARGVCLLLRRELVEEIGLLDRNLKFICSDVDYCLSARERGWQVWRVGNALGEHEPDGGSTGSANARLGAIKSMDALFFANKWLTGDVYRKLMPAGETLTSEAVAAGMRRLRGEPESVKLSPSRLGYFAQPRPEILELVSTKARIVLDIGCGAGALARVLKARQPCHVSGIEQAQEIASLAEDALDTFYAGNAMSILPRLPDTHFDTIIMADVLEHLVETDQVLSWVWQKLKIGGELILSLPNVNHWSVLRDLLQGRWEYREHGILDRTHLRFFTHRSAMETLQRHGFDIQRTEATHTNLQVPEGLAAALASCGVAAPNIEHESRCFQYLFKARKTERPT